MAKVGEGLLAPHDSNDLVPRQAVTERAHPDSVLDEPLLQSSLARATVPLARSLPFGRLQPWFAGVWATVAGYLALLGATVLLGWFLLDVVLPGWVNHTDNQANFWLAGRRTPMWNSISTVGSGLGETITVVAICGLTVFVLVRRRRWLTALFLGLAILLEALVYLGTVLVINRPRPHVVRLENLGSGASFPSGHTAAAFVAYVGLAMIVCASTCRPALRRAVIALAVIAPSTVAVARVYRGMHHPIDVLSGALMGFGCLVVGLLVAQVVGLAWERRRAERLT